MPSSRLSDFRRSVGKAIKAIGQAPAPGSKGPAPPPGERSEAAVRERLYGKRGPGR